jgi:hypothetical protein
MGLTCFLLRGTASSKSGYFLVLPRFVYYLRLTLKVIAMFSSNGNFPFFNLPMIFERDSAPNVRRVHRSAFLLLWWRETSGCLRLFVTQLLLLPGLITMIIASTRMHRFLIDFASGSPDVYDA